MLECFSRDGSACVNIAMLPDGSLDEGSQAMLKDVGAWMTINGEAIYGSHAWTKFGEKTGGDNGSKSTDFRFTLGKDGAIYAFSFGVPAGRDQITIASLGSNSKALKSAIKSVTLLGSTDPSIGRKNRMASRFIAPRICH